MALSPGDPSSYSRPDLVKTTHLHLDLDLDFAKSIMVGQVVLSMEKVDNSVTSVLLDCKQVDIDSVTLEATGEQLTFKIDGETSYGSRLEIQLPASCDKQFKLVIKYATRPECSALQWLSPEQTAGGTHPYVFSQCQAIHCRAMTPCQDTPSVKATYSASISAPEGITVLMSAIRKHEETKKSASDGKTTFCFNQPVPVQSYLIAIAAGALVSKRIGPRSHVWTEEKFLDLSVSDFSDTENMLKIAEDLCGPYVWGEYDILVLPPSFPFGGMENPCLTFVTPTLLSGDKSNANVITHEIAHSWTGNLVTNFNFEHFWLNEGFTRFVEAKIQGLLYGDPHRHFNGLLSWPALSETITEIFGSSNPLTQLVVDLKGIDPDDAFSSVPYEKGSAFLWYLEGLVGGPEVMNAFLKSYFNKFKYLSITTDQFKAYFLEYFKDNKAVEEIDWIKWLYAPGMPPFKPPFDDSMAVVCHELAKRWQEWDPETTDCPFTKDDIKDFSGGQLEEMLNCLVSGKPLSLPVVKKMNEIYSLFNSPNVEIQFRWIRICIAARWDEVVPHALKLVTDVGRMKFTRPVYRDMYGWEEKRAETVATFMKTKDKMMAVSRTMIAKDMHLQV